jgi:hypothetical protein
MSLLAIPRLTVERQRALGAAIEALLKPAVARAKLPVAVAERAPEFVAAHAALAGVAKLPKLAVDNTADRTYSGAYKSLKATVQTFSLTLVPMKPTAVRRRDAAQSLLALAFPAEIVFLKRSMDLQYKVMRDVVRALRSKAAADDVKALGFGDTVDVLEALLAPYGVAVQGADGADVEKLSDAWHGAFSNLAAALVGSLPEGDALRDGVLGAYQKSLDAQSALTAAKIRRRKKAAPATASE